MIDEERWVPIPGYEGYYSISNRGRVRSEARRVPATGYQWRDKPAKIIRTRTQARKSPAVYLSKDGDRKQIRVSVLMEEAFGVNA